MGYFHILTLGITGPTGGSGVNQIGRHGFQ